LIAPFAWLKSGMQTTGCFSTFPSAIQSFNAKAIAPGLRQRRRVGNRKSSSPNGRALGNQASVCGLTASKGPNFAGHRKPGPVSLPALAGLFMTTDAYLLPGLNIIAYRTLRENGTPSA
jgi:hypothetical protein